MYLICFVHLFNFGFIKFMFVKSDLSLCILIVLFSCFVLDFSLCMLFVSFIRFKLDVLFLCLSSQALAVALQVCLIS